MSGVSRICIEPSPDCGCRRMSTSSATKGRQMKPIPHPDVATGLQVPLAVAVAAVLGVSGGLISPANAQTFSSSYTSTAPKDCRVVGAGNGVDDSHDPGLSGQGRTGGAGQRGRSARDGFGRPQPRRGGQGTRRAGLVRPVQLDHHDRRMARARRQAFAIIQRWHIADNSDQDKDERPIAKPMLAVTRLPPGRGVPCRLCRREGQSQRQ